MDSRNWPDDYIGPMYCHLRIGVYIVKNRIDTGILGLVKRSNISDAVNLKTEVYRLTNENKQLKENVTSLMNTIRILNLKVDNLINGQSR